MSKGERETVTNKRKSSEKGGVRKRLGCTKIAGAGLNAVADGWKKSRQYSASSVRKEGQSDGIKQTIGREARIPRGSSSNEKTRETERSPEKKKKSLVALRLPRDRVRGLI